MDRQLSDVEARSCGEGFSPAIPLHGDLHGDHGYLPPEPPETPFFGAEQDTPLALRALTELDARYDPALRTLFTYIRPAGRPSFTVPMLSDFESWQGAITAEFGPGRMPLDYLVLGSRVPGVWCFGGDLGLFQRLIRDADRGGLTEYGRRCVRILHRNFHALDLPVLTVGLVQGQALGGGLEALLSFDFIIAERGTTFGLPEVMFGLFPGMGAHALLSRRLGTAQAERMILSNKTYTAEDFYDMGLITQLAAPGEGETELRGFLARSSRRHAGLVGARRAMRRAAPLELAELYDIVDLWADSALQVTENDLRLMARLVSAQERRAVA